MRARPNSIGAAIVALVCLLMSAGETDATGPCAIDFNLNGTRDTGDVLIFLSIYPGSTYADINADLVVDVQDVLAFVAHYDLPACPCWADYNADEAVDINDLLIFANLYSAGDLRADLTLDGLLTPADMTAFLDCYGYVGAC